jgi:hypothetical protein
MIKLPRSFAAVPLVVPFLAEKRGPPKKVPGGSFAFSMGYLIEAVLDSATGLLACAVSCVGERALALLASVPSEVMRVCRARQRDPAIYLTFG